MVILLAGVGILMLLGFGASALVSKLVREGRMRDAIRTAKVAAATVVILALGPSSTPTEAQRRAVERVTAETRGPVEVIQVYDPDHVADALEIAQEEGFAQVDLEEDVVVVKAPTAPVLNEDREDRASGMSSAFDDW